jgi:hypothetical protein
MGLLKEQDKDADDEVLQLNPTLYKVVQAAIEEGSSDPFHKIMEQQQKWSE